MHDLNFCYDFSHSGISKCCVWSVREHLPCSLTLPWTLLLPLFASREKFNAHYLRGHEGCCYPSVPSQVRLLGLKSLLMQLNAWLCKSCPSQSALGLKTRLTSADRRGAEENARHLLLLACHPSVTLLAKSSRWGVMAGWHQGAIWPALAQKNKWDEIQLSDKSTRGLVLLRPANAAALSAHPSNPSWGCAAARGVSCA